MATEPGSIAKIGLVAAVLGLMGAAIGVVKVLVPDHPPAAAPKPSTSSPSINIPRSASAATPTHSSAPMSLPSSGPTNQSPYVLRWQGKLTIGLAGVNVTETGIYPGDGGNYNLQYQPGSDGGWQTRMSAELSFYYWLPNTAPDPASCVGKTEDANAMLPDPANHSAHVGDQYCYVDFGLQPTVVASIRVIGLRANGVTVNARLWNKS